MNKTMVFVLGVFAVLSTYRTIHFAQTGFFISDEFGYVYNAIYGDIYGTRWFFGGMNALLFKFFGIHSIDSFLFLMPFYLFFWPALTIIVFFKMMKELGFDAKTISLSLLSSLFLISFVVLSLGFLTEPVGLAMAILGCFFLIRHLRRVSRFLPLASALSFAAATYTREPYAIFLVGGAIALLFSARRLLSLIIFGLPSILFLLFPTNELAGAFSNTVGSGAGPAASAHILVPLVPRMIETMKIFGFGILLGWGPILTVLATLGFVFLVKPKRLNASILTLSLIAILSYAVVAFIFSIDPSFLIPKYYSALIRFSDTSLPAYFLMAPFAISTLSKRRAFSYGLPTALVLFLTASIPLYGGYAGPTLEVNPTTPTLAYRTLAAEVRDFLLAHPTQEHRILINPPFGWIFTPGIDRLNMHVFFSNPTPKVLFDYPDSRVGLYYERLIIPYLSYADFVKLKPTSFYIYSNTTDASSKLPSYLLEIVASGSAPIGLPFTVLHSEILIKEPNIIFVHVELSWN